MLAMSQNERLVYCNYGAQVNCIESQKIGIFVPANLACIKSTFFQRLYNVTYVSIFTGVARLWLLTSKKPVKMQLSIFDFFFLPFLYIFLCYESK